MKIQTEVITTFGNFFSDISDEIENEHVDQLKAMYKECYNLDYLSIMDNGKIIYFPSEVIRKSIIILHIFE